MNTVGQLASGIWVDLNEPQTPSITYISGWIESSRGLGKLNLLLDTCFGVDVSGLHAGETYYAGHGYSGTYGAGDFYPTMGQAEISIYTEVYKADYYDKAIRDAMNGLISVGSGSAVDWNELREGDSVIKRSNRNELAKTYRLLLNDSKAELNRLVGFYKQNLARPRQVAGDDAP